MSGHTPGPWSISPHSMNSDAHTWVIAGEKRVAQLGLTNEELANARLIVVAPELLDALEKAADTLRDAATAYRFFGKRVAAEAMELAEKFSRAVLAKAVTP